MNSFVTHQDDELVTRCLSGHPEGVRAFVERFQGAVFGLCFRMLAHREDAEDVTQEVFVRALRALERWDRERPVLPWLLTIAANRCRTALASRRRHPTPSDLAIDVAERSPLSSCDLSEELQVALEKVRDEYRLCFILYHVNELNLSEIGEVVGAPVGTIKTWLSRARRELAAHLRRRGVVSEVNHELR
jgi:RNA polymerase sigma-70 factor (ECF subfamily)